MNCIKDGKYTGDSCFGCPVKANECEITLYKRAEKGQRRNIMPERI